MSHRRAMAAQVAAAPSGQETFSGGSDAEQTFTVPAGVTEIAVKMWGAGGFGARGDVGAGGGGGGGAVRFKLAVTPGESLTIACGQRNQNSNGGYANWPNGGKGKFIDSTHFGGTGGGRSYLKRGTTLLAIAAGGGGGGYSTAGTQGTEPGKAGGTESAATAYIGGGGTQSAGGAKATQASSWYGAYQQTDGSALQAGHAGYNNISFGGGGGDGYYGGGGGSTDGSWAGGGGGGSNYINTTYCTNYTAYAGSGTTPGNASDPDRGTAGVGGTGGTETTGHYGGIGFVVIEYGAEISW